jgi:hypothetical protein
MVSKTGDFFDVTIAPFTLSEPYTVHLASAGGTSFPG